MPVWPFSAANIKHVMAKVQRLCPEVPRDAQGNLLEDLPRRAVQVGVLNLVEAAIDPRNICRMEPTWHPWF